MKAAHLSIRNSIQVMLWLLWLLNSLFLLYNWVLEEWCYILIVNCTHEKPAWGKSFSLTLWNLVFKCLYLQYLWADLVKCTEWRTACFCIVLRGCVGSIEGVNVKWAECSYCILAAFFTIVTLSNQAHSSGLTASRAAVPRALWARHWTTGLRSSGSLSAQHSTPGQPVLSLTHTRFYFLCCLCGLACLQLGSLSGLLLFPVTYWVGQTASCVSIVNFTPAGGQQLISGFFFLLSDSKLNLF